MKRFIILILIFCISLHCVNASKDSILVFYQGKPILQNQNLTINKEANNLLDAIIKIQNLSKTKTALKIIQTVKQLPDSCYLQFCFGGICWVGDTSAYYSLLPESSDSTFKPIFYFGSKTQASAKVSYCIIDSSFSDSFYFTLEFKPIINQIEVFSRKEPQVFYLRNERRIQFKNINSDILSIRIIDLSGREIFYSQQKIYSILIPDNLNSQLLIIFLNSKKSTHVKKIIL
jgi:hypothetical protein